MLTPIRRLYSRVVGYYTRTAWKAFLALTAIVGTTVIVVAVWRNFGAAAGFALAATAGAFLLLIGGTPIQGPQRWPETRDASEPETSDGTAPVTPTVARSRPIVTIVVAARNEARFIADCLTSVAGQTYPDFECLVIDDGSTDDTLDRVVDRLAPDQRFQFFSNDQSIGLAAVRNQGLELARGEYITFLDGDDVLYPNAIAVRVTPLLGRNDPTSWVAGIFCDWRPVAEAFEVGAPPQGQVKRERVTWFNTLTDAPFIASAPVLRTEVARNLGGFANGLETAEDAAFWNTVLRSGFVFDYVPYVGIAYRQKRRSMFRDTMDVHARIVADIVASNFREAGPEEFAAAAPCPYSRPAGDYMAKTTLFRRLVTGLAIAVESGSADAAGSPRHAVEEAYEPYFEWVLDLSELAGQAAGRATLPSPELDHRAAIRLTVHDALIRIATDHRHSRPESSSTGPSAHLGVPAPQELRSVTTPELVTGRDPVADRIVLYPSAGYHVAELDDLANWLQQAGVESVMAVPPRLWRGVAPALRVWRGSSFVQPESAEWTREARALVTLNDWGPTGRDVQFAKANAIPTFGKVEGAQDFRDDDVPFELHGGRDAYRTVELVLAQGQNDADSLASQATHIVGSTRLERIWLAPPRAYQGDLAVINVNFTYHILEEAREMWVQSAVRACEQMRVPYILSLHPAEKSRYEGRFPVADQAMRHLLTEASVLISRFSTVPFEAMARGVPFVYHNPHREKVPTFKEPNDAFDVSYDVASLADALGASTKWVSNYRDRAGDFFLHQVDVDPSRPSGLRSAEVILAAIS